MLTYNLPIDLPREYNYRALHDDIEAVEPTFTGLVTSGPLLTLYFAGADPADTTAIDAVVARVDALEANKQQRRVLIDTRTREVISRGFTHGGLTFSLSREAQIYFSNMYVARDILAAQGAFPLTINTQDDLATYDVADATEVATIYTTAVGTVKAALGSGTDLKKLVRAATTQAELDAVVDNR